MTAPSGSSDLELGAGFLLGILAAPGTFYCFLLFQKYSSLLDYLRGRRGQDVYLASAPDKFFLICLAMAVTGIITVLKWDRLLPDSQDYLNLGPLPIRARNILLANAAAISIAVMVVALDVSAIPALLFPAFVMASVHASPSAFASFAAAHAICVLLASLFSICGVFALLGTLAAILPRETFRSCSSWVRGLLLVALLMLLPVGFAGTSVMRTAILHPDSLLRFFPPLWYLGLYQTWQHRSTPVLAGLAHMAVASLPVVFGIMLATYAMSYRKRFGEVLEGSRQPSEQRLFALVLALLDLFSRRASGFERACHRFAVRALLRNETHRLAIAVSVGLGGLVASQDLANVLPAVVEKATGLPAIALLQAPLAAAYLLILGLRIAIELPAGVPANWVFRAVLDSRENEGPPVARRVMLSFLTPLVITPTLLFSWWAWGWMTAALHVLYVVALSVSLIEIQLAGYRKAPLTCPMPGFRDNLLMLCLVQFLGFELFTRAGAAVEQWMLEMPVKFLLVPAAMAGAWYWNRRRIAEAREAGELEEGVTFENVPVRAVERLDLSDSV